MVVLRRVGERIAERMDFVVFVEEAKLAAHAPDLIDGEDDSLNDNNRDQAASNHVASGLDREYGHEVRNDGIRVHAPSFLIVPPEKCLSAGRPIRLMFSA
jgi:hypothetical protein